MTSSAGPVSAAVKAMDMIEVEGLRLRCVIGCTTEERRGRSDVVIDLTVGIDARPAGSSDDLADAWDYRAATDSDRGRRGIGVFHCGGADNQDRPARGL